MFKKHSSKLVILGLIFTIAVAVVNVICTYFFFEPDRLIYLLDVGIDALGALVCAALYFGYMRQEGEGATYFRALNLTVSVGFLANELMYLTMDEPDSTTFCFVFCIVCKLTDLAMVIFFYMYVRQTLDFKGKLVKFADKFIPITAILQAILILSNIFYPVTFMINESGAYEYVDGLIWTEDIFLLLISIITAILIIRCDSPRSQKVAALLFYVFSIVGDIATFGTFGNAAMYGMVLLPLIITYCIIFNDKSAKLAATESELNLATDIQASMLPSIFPVFPEREEFDIHATMDPAKEVGGDFYDFYMIDEDHLGIVIADVSGKGVPAALFMMSSKILISDHAQMGGTPAEVLERVNKQILANNDTKMFVTVWLAFFEISTGKLIWANAGHEYPMINVNGQYELLKDKHGIALGVIKKAKYENQEITLKRGDSFFVYTDGVAEATSIDEELFETDRTLEALNSMPDGISQEEVLKGVRKAVDTFVDKAPQFDDITMVGFKYYGPEGKQ